jgi:hypothetical protein
MSIPGEKISQLFNAATLTGTEPVPVVQGGVTVQTSTASIAALGRFATQMASTLTGNPTGSPAPPSAITLGANLSFAGTVLNAAGGGGGGALAFSNIATATLSATQNNVALASGINWLQWTAASGGSTVTGLSATNATAGALVYVRNYSTTDTITFPHLSGSSSAGNLFSCPQGVSNILGALSGMFLIYDLANTIWTLA